MVSQPLKDFEKFRETLFEMADKADPPIPPVKEEIMDHDELEKWKTRAEEDARINSVLIVENTLNKTFDNRSHMHPHGLTHYDYSSIPRERREGLEKFKMKVRHENYSYLHQLTELDGLIQLFLRKVLLAQPADPIRFAAEFFSSKKTKVTGSNIMEEILDQKRKIERYRLAHPKVKMPSVNSLLMKRPKDLHSLQSLNIQPHAYDFKFEKEKIVLPAPVVEIKPPPKPAELPKKKHNCGCKDPGRKTIYKPEPKESDVKSAVAFKDGPPKVYNYALELMGEEEEYIQSREATDSRGMTPITTTADEEDSAAEGSVNYEADEDESTADEF